MGPIVIKAGRVFDGQVDRALEQAYVMISGEVITVVGAQSELDGSRGQFEQEIDLGAGVTLLPGLINMHTHMSFSLGDQVFADHQADSYALKLIRSVENLKRALHSGVTTMRDCGTLNGIAFAGRDAVARGDLQGPRILSSYSRSMLLSLIGRERSPNGPLDEPGQKITIPPQPFHRRAS